MFKNIFKKPKDSWNSDRKQAQKQTEKKYDFASDQLDIDSAAVLFFLAIFSIVCVVVIDSETKSLSVGDVFSFPAKNIEGVLYSSPVQVEVVDENRTCTLNYSYIAKHTGSMMVVEDKKHGYYVGHWQGESTSEGNSCNESQNVILTRDELWNLSRTSRGTIDAQAIYPNGQASIQTAVPFLPDTK